MSGDMSSGDSQTCLKTQPGTAAEDEFNQNNTHKQDDKDFKPQPHYLQFINDKQYSTYDIKYQHQDKLTVSKIPLYRLSGTIRR